MSIGEQIDVLYDLREQKRELNKQIAQIDLQYESIEHDILRELGAMGIETAKSTKASATVSKKIVPNVQDWDAFYKYILSTEQPFLLERRPSVTAFRDLHNAGEEIPGVTAFEQTSLSLRTR